MSKFKKFCLDNKTILLSGGIVFLCLLVVFVYSGKWPFGSNGMAIYDLAMQIAPQSTFVYDIFQGKSTPFYTNRMGGGINIVSTIIYFFISPFYIIVLLGGRANVFYLINIAYVAYLVCIAISMSYMLKKVFPKLSQVYQLILSVLYAFCGFVTVTYTFLTWLSYMILLPLMVVAFLRMIKTGKYLWFSFLTFLFIITCFGVGTMSQFILLAIYYLYVLICVKKKERSKILTTLTISILIGVLLSSIVIVPAYIEALDGMRVGGFFDYIFKTDIKKEYEVKLTYLITDFALTTIGILFMLFSNKKDKLNRFLSIAILGFLLLLLIDVAFMLLNFGINFGYPTRFCFFNSFFAVLATAKAILDGKDNYKDRQFVVSKKGKITIWSIWIFVSLLFVVLMVINGYYFEHTDRYSVNSLSQADLKIILGFACVFVLEFILSFLLFRLKLINIKTMKIATCVMLCGQVVFSLMVISGEGTDQRRYIVTNELMSICGDYDRVVGTYMNDAMIGNVSTISIFSSSVAKRNIEAFLNLGYETRSNGIYNNGGTLFTDSLLGIKYKTSNKMLDETYLTLANSVDLNIDDEKNTMYLYEYNFATTGAFVVNDDYKWDNKVDIFTNQNLLATAMGAEQDIFEVYSIAELLKNNISGFLSVMIDNLQMIGQTTYIKTSSNSPASIKISFLAENSEDYICYYYSTYDDNNSSNNYIQNFEEDFSYNLADDNEVDLARMHVAIMNISNYEEQFERIKQSQVKINYKADGFTFDLTNVGENKQLIVSNVNVKGLSATKNGQKISIDNALTGFVGIKLNAGDNIIVVSHTYPYLVPVAIICTLCIMLAVAIIILFNKKRNWFLWLEKIVKPLYASYGIVFVGFIFVFSIGVTIYKLFIIWI